MTRTLHFTYFFDPLCGWCYAASPALKRLAQTHGERLRMMPMGLFVTPRPVSIIADHARANDDRIAQLTGLPFTDAYHTRVMRAPGGVFTSLPLSRALVLLGRYDPALEPRFLNEAQTARYVEGRDTSRSEIVAEIAVNVMRGSGTELDEAAVIARIEDDPELASETERRIEQAREIMTALGIQGVPQLVVNDDHGSRIVDGRTLYAGGDALIAALGEKA